jgi:serine/threonine protein kinase/Flp pilus assembly protein TadD
MQQPNGTAAPPADSRTRELERYLAAAEAGTAPAREEFLARYPELADDLDACLATLRFIHRAVAGPHAAAVSVSGIEPAEEGTRRLGDFRIVREVGRGGMGVVYEAEQISLGRRVALKVLPFAATLDPRQLQRFHNEARAAASLDHPHIVHVHAVGCERAVHFYAMQFIDGQTLAALISDLRRRGSPPANDAPRDAPPHVPGPPAPPAAETAAQGAISTLRAPRDRDYFRRVAELGAQAAQALDHAHALGIVHRDVKPANLMVDGRGGLWVTDFGLAHIQSDTRLTMTGDLVGTLRYMSPEQALSKRAVVDHRTDVYSLGTTLYELLTLEPAVTGTDRQELLRQIAFEDPTPPRRRNRAVPADLETIVLKAMEKNALDRYTTAKELADDLQRFLADRPIRARPAGLAKRLRGWGRRHPAIVASAVAALLAAVAVLSGGIGWVASDHAARAVRTTNEVGTALGEANALQRRRPSDALAAARRALAALAGGHADAELRRRVEARKNDLEMLARLEEARLEVITYSDSPRDRETFDRRFREIFHQLIRDVEGGSAEEVGKSLRNSTVVEELAAFLDDWAALCILADPHRPARWKGLLVIARAADPDPWRSRLRMALAARDRPLLERLASEDEVKHLLPWSRYALTRVLFWQSATRQAEKLLREAQRRRPDDFWTNADLGFLLTSSKPPRDVEAIPFLTAAVALRPESPGARFNLGLSLARKGDVDEAATNFRESIRLKADNPRAHHHLGNALLRQRDMDGALTHFREAIHLKAAYPEAHCNLGLILAHKGDLVGAIAACREAINLKADHPEAYCNLGVALVGTGDVHGAVAAFREAIRLKPDNAEAHLNLGRALKKKGQFAEALTHFRRGHEQGSRRPDWPFPSAKWVQQAQALAELDSRATTILKGEAEAKSASESLLLARFCLDKKKYPAAAARLYSDAFAAEPELASDLAASDRFAAAKAAALAGGGCGGDATALDELGRVRWRNQALNWLRADLKSWTKKLRGGDAEEADEVRETLGRWQREPAFAGVRGPDALGKLPKPERAGWCALWEEVAALTQNREETHPR